MFLLKGYDAKNERGKYFIMHRSMVITSAVVECLVCNYTQRGCVYAQRLHHLEHGDAPKLFYHELCSLHMNGSRGRGSQKEAMFLFELVVAPCVLFTREGGGRCWDAGCWVLRRWVRGGSSMIGKSQALSFCHVVSFFISRLIFHWRASSIHSNLFFSSRRGS